jgi:hypothetical protein
MWSTELLVFQEGPDLDIVLSSLPIYLLDHGIQEIAFVWTYASTTTSSMFAGSTLDLIPWYFHYMLQIFHLFDKSTPGSINFQEVSVFL